MSALPHCELHPDWELMLLRWEQQGTPPPSERIHWLYSLREYLNRDSQLSQHPRYASTRARMRSIAMACDDLPLLCYLAECQDALDELSPQETLQFISAQWRRGKLRDALESCTKLLLQWPNIDGALGLYRQLLAWNAHIARLPIPYHDCYDGDLYLQPLGHQHVDDFRWQYADSKIAELCCLPQFIDDRHWHAWLCENQQLRDQVLLGVWHQHWGLIGCVSLVVNDETGFFYYWLGADFRGCGFAPQAGKLLLRVAQQHWGMRACYAKVFVDNHASQRGLQKCGFALTDVPISTPESPPEILMRWPNSSAHDAEEIRALLWSMDSETWVSRPLVT